MCAWGQVQQQQKAGHEDGTRDDPHGPGSASSSQHSCGGQRLRVLSTLPPSLPARRPCPAPCLLGGGAPAKRGCVCVRCVSLPPERAGRKPGKGWRGPRNHKASFASRSNQSCSCSSGNLRWAEGAPPAAGACADLRLRLQGQGDLSPWLHTPALPCGLSHTPILLSPAISTPIFSLNTPRFSGLGYPLPLHVRPALQLHLGSPSSRPRFCTCRAICPGGPSSHPPCQTDSSKIITGVTCT